MKVFWDVFKVPAILLFFFFSLRIADWINDNKPLWDWNRAIRKHWTFYLDGVEIPPEDIQNYYFCDIHYDKKTKSVYSRSLRNEFSEDAIDDEVL